MIDNTLGLLVMSRRTAAEGVVMLELVAATGQALPDWSPGAHIDLHLPNGMVRQYSLCGRVQDPARWCVAVLREPAGRGGSACVHNQIAVGDVLPGGGPRNHFSFTLAGR